jgi:hypothetical protein
VADGGRLRRLGDRARALGFGDLHGYLQARCDAGWSVPGLAAELGTSEWYVGAALEVVGVRVASAAERRARTRMRASELRLAARVAELGFGDVEGYLRDRLVSGGWLLSEVEVELGAHRRTVRRLMEAAGIRRVRRTAAERAAAAAGKQSQQLGWEARRAARLAELGFDSMEAYVRARVGQGWSVKRMRAELRVGIAWLRGKLDRLRLTSSP